MAEQTFSPVELVATDGQTILSGRIRVQKTIKPGRVIQWTGTFFGVSEGPLTFGAHENTLRFDDGSAWKILIDRFPMAISRAGTVVSLAFKNAGTPPPLITSPRYEA